MVCLWKQVEITVVWDCTQILHFQLNMLTMRASSKRDNGHLSYIHPFQSILIHLDSWNVDVHSCYLLFDHFQFILIHGPNITGSSAVLFSTALDHHQPHPAFSLWLHLLLTWGVPSFSVVLSFHTVYGVHNASPVGHMSSELSTMTCLGQFHWAFHPQGCSPCELVAG